MISIYSANEKLFDSNGIKIVKPAKAIVHKEDNGDYYMDLKDSIDYLEYYQSGNIELAFSMENEEWTIIFTIQKAKNK